ncbi:MAG: HNH endonuclease [Aliarcobacter sp.]|nr:HNH endonuclease [Aliarcobacter sp.]
MINFLQNRTLLNKLEISSNFISQRMIYDSHAIQYLRELPPNFLELQYKRNKKEEITKHLKSIYSNITDEKVENVLSRVQNLIKYVTNTNRKDYEDFTKQHNFKEKNWKRIERCEVCGFKFRIQSDATLEHVLPLSLGGADNDTNWQLLCKSCNGHKTNYWGVSDLKLVDSFISKDILKLTKVEDIQKRLPKDIKYFIIESQKRKCSYCQNTSSEAKIEVKLELTSVLNIDSFSTICETCIKTKKVSRNILLN